MLLNTNISSRNNVYGVKIISDSYHNSSYMYSAIYEEYIQTKIDNERRLANHIKQYIPVTESAHKQITAIYEAKAGDSAKAKWNKFIEFIKNMFAKFAERITHLLIDEKSYLEKYKKIILEKTPKEGNEYSIPGEYKEAIYRCINTHVPVFNYASFENELKNKESDGPLAAKIMQNSRGFSYDEGDSLAENFKNYFLAHDKGTQSGTFNDGSLNFTDMYNFCYNSGKIKEITTKDENYLNQSTNAIINAVNTELNKNAATNESYISEANGGSTVTSGDGGAVQTPPNPAPSSGGSTVTSGDGGAAQTSQSGNKDGDSLKSKIGATKNNDAVSKMNSYENRDAVSDDQKNENINAAQGQTEQEMNEIMDKWLRVCRALIGAKLTAVQQIASDYMKIIRLHVQSYVGNDKDDKDNRSKQTASNYQKDNNNNAPTSSDNGNTDTTNTGQQDGGTVVGTFQQGGGTAQKGNKGSKKGNKGRNRGNR